jgi:hypothetical protein
MNLKFTPNFTIVYSVIYPKPLPAMAEYILNFALDKAFFSIRPDENQNAGLSRK